MGLLQTIRMVCDVDDVGRLGVQHWSTAMKNLQVSCAIPVFSVDRVYFETIAEITFYPTRKKLSIYKCKNIFPWRNSLSSHGDLRNR